MEKGKIINWKEERDKALKYMVEFKRLGDSEKAEQMLKLAVHINNIRTEIPPILVDLSI